jgi:hypothetical protein
VIRAFLIASVHLRMPLTLCAITVGFVYLLAPQISIARLTDAAVRPELSVSRAAPALTEQRLESRRGGFD